MIPSNDRCTDSINIMYVLLSLVTDTYDSRRDPLVEVLFIDSADPLLQLGHVRLVRQLDEVRAHVLFQPRPDIRVCEAEQNNQLIEINTKS